MSSAVRSPRNRLYSRRANATMSWSISSPPMRIDRLTTMPPSEMTATSVVPPPMSTMSEPDGSDTGSPAPIAAAIGSSIRRAQRAPALSAASRTARFSTSVTPDGMPEQHPRPRDEPDPVVHLVHEVLDHLLGHVEVADDPVAERADGDDRWPASGRPCASPRRRSRAPAWSWRRSRRPTARRSRCPGRGHGPACWRCRGRCRCRGRRGRGGGRTCSRTGPCCVARASGGAWPSRRPRGWKLGREPGDLARARRAHEREAV